MSLITFVWTTSPPASWAPTINPNYGPGFGRTMRMHQPRAWTDGGKLYSYNHGESGERRFGWNNLPTADLTALIALFDAIGPGRSFTLTDQDGISFTQNSSPRDPWNGRKPAAACGTSPWSLRWHDGNNAHIHRYLSGHDRSDHLRSGSSRRQTAKGLDVPGKKASGGENGYTYNKELAAMIETIPLPQLHTAEYTALMALIAAVDGVSSQFDYTDLVGTSLKARFWNTDELVSSRVSFGREELTLELQIETPP